MKFRYGHAVLQGRKARKGIFSETFVILPPRIYPITGIPGLFNFVLQVFQEYPLALGRKKRGVFDIQQQLLQPKGQPDRNAGTFTIVVWFGATTAVAHQLASDVTDLVSVTFRQYEPERIFLSKFTGRIPQECHCMS